MRGLTDSTCYYTEPTSYTRGETDHFDRARRVVDLQKTQIDRVEIQVIKL